MTWLELGEGCTGQLGEGWPGQLGEGWPGQLGEGWPGQLGEGGLVRVTCLKGGLRAHGLRVTCSGSMQGSLVRVRGVKGGRVRVHQEVRGSLIRDRGGKGGPLVIQQFEHNFETNFLKSLKSVTKFVW